MPKATIIFTTKPRYSFGLNSDTRSGPPMSFRKSRARGRLQYASPTPRKNSITPAATNGIA